MNEFFKEPINPFSTDPEMEEPKEKKHYERTLPVGRESTTARIELNGFRNPKLIGCRLDGSTVTLKLEQDALPDQLIEDCLYE